MKFLKYKTLLTIALPLLLVLAVLVVPGVAHAGSASIGAACEGLNQLPDGSCANNGSTAVNIGSKGVQLLSIVAGIIAVIMLIVAGFQYITSAGDANKVGKAKNSLIYSIVGLVIVALAQFLVHVVLVTAK